jgi:hypothetical protein
MINVTSCVELVPARVRCTGGGPISVDRCTSHLNCMYGSPTYSTSSLFSTHPLRASPPKVFPLSFENLGEMVTLSPKFYRGF